MTEQKINKIYLTSILPRDIVLQYDNAARTQLQVNTKEMIKLIDSEEAANEITVYVKDGHPRLMKRVQKLLDNSVFGFKEEVSVEPERYATNYYTFTISKQIWIVG